MLSASRNAQFPRRQLLTHVSISTQIMNLLCKALENIIIQGLKPRIQIGESISSRYRLSSALLFVKKPAGFSFGLIGVSFIKGQLSVMTESQHQRWQVESQNERLNVRFLQPLTLIVLLNSSLSIQTISYYSEALTNFLCLHQNMNFIGNTLNILAKSLQ